ncbi:DUF5933 domain-containing protein, partial [Streptomyces sp. NPDC096012]|uniref:DUF5933 domain-containing protein n=1 Tax=Streptomyces sp. NPDC096012 TaxID=3155684 RepID=UPI00336A5650
MATGSRPARTTARRRRHPPLFVLARWILGVGTSDGHFFGNGALWVVLGYAV